MISRALAIASSNSQAKRVRVRKRRDDRVERASIELGFQDNPVRKVCHGATIRRDAGRHPAARVAHIPFEDACQIR